MVIWRGGFSVKEKLSQVFWRDGRVPRLFASHYTLSFCAASFRKNLSSFIFLDSNLSRSYLYSRNFGNARFLSPRPTDRSHNFPPILMEHQRGHVSSTFPLTDKSPADSADFSIERLRFLAGFLAGNSSGGREKQESGKRNPGKLDRERVLHPLPLPDLQTQAAATRFSIIYRWRVKTWENCIHALLQLFPPLFPPFPWISNLGAIRSLESNDQATLFLALHTDPDEFLPFLDARFIEWHEIFEILGLTVGEEVEEERRR